MTLIVKPKGRGNWHVYEITIKRTDVAGLAADFVDFRPGMLIPFGPWTFRVVEVRP